MILINISEEALQNERSELQDQEQESNELAQSKSPYELEHFEIGNLSYFDWLMSKFVDTPKVQALHCAKFELRRQLDHNILIQTI